MTETSSPSSPQGLGLRAQLLIAFGLIAGMAVLACAVAIIAFSQIEGRLRDITMSAQPRMAASKDLALIAGRVAANAPLLAAAESDSERQRVAADLSSQLATLRQGLTRLQDLAGEAATSGLGQPIAQMAASVSNLDRVTADRQQLERNRQAAFVQLDQAERAVAGVLAPMVTRAVEETAAGGGTLADEGDLAIEGLQTLVGDALATVQDLRVLIATMGEAARDYQGGAMAALGDFETAAARAVTLLTRLSFVDEAAATSFRPNLEALVAMGVGPEGVFRVLPAEADIRVTLLVSQRRRVAEQLDTYAEEVKSKVELAGTDLAQRTRMGIEALIDERVGALRRLLELQSALQSLAGALGEGGSATDTAAAEQVKSRATAQVEAVTRALASLPQAFRNAELTQRADHILVHAEPHLGVIDMRVQELALIAEGTRLLAATRGAAATLTDAIGNEVTAAEALSARASANAENALEISRQLLYAVGVLALVFAGLIVWLFVGRQIAARMTSLASAMGKIAGGDLETEVPKGGSGEIGQMAQALNQFKDALAAQKRLEAEQAMQELRSEERRREELHKLANRFEQQVKTVVSTLSTVATKLDGDAASLVETADITTQQADAVSQAADSTAHNVETGAAAAEELAASISEIGRQVEAASGVARRAVEQADETNHTVEGLSEAARRIGDVVQLIANIAKQTNLLALNATIEASRAGDAGRGFAVVASEVKTLATQTAQATEEIADQIRSMQGATDTAVGAIRDISATIRRMDEIATTIAAAVEEQQAATAEIARTVQEAARGTAEVTGTIGEVRSAASETRLAGDRVVDTAGEVVKQSGTLDREVERFLAQIRSG